MAHLFRHFELSVVESSLFPSAFRQHWLSGRKAIQHVENFADSQRFSFGRNGKRKLKAQVGQLINTG